MNLMILLSFVFNGPSAIIVCLYCKAISSTPILKIRIICYLLVSSISRIQSAINRYNWKAISMLSTVPAPAVAAPDVHQAKFSVCSLSLSFRQRAIKTLINKCTTFSFGHFYLWLLQLSFNENWRSEPNQWKSFFSHFKEP